MLAQCGQQLAALHSRPLHEVPYPLFTEAGLQLIGCDGTVWAASHPRARYVAVSAPIQIMDRIAQAASDHISRQRPTAKDRAKDTSETTRLSRGLS